MRDAWTATPRGRRERIASHSSDPPARRPTPSERWKIEGGSPSVLFRVGWNRDSMPAGTKVTVVGFQAKDGSLRASSREIRFPDGSAWILVVRDPRRSI